MKLSELALMELRGKTRSSGRPTARAVRKSCVSIKLKHESCYSRQTSAHTSGSRGRDASETRNLPIRAQNLFMDG